MSRKKVLKILYNGSHSSKNIEKHIPQGGPARFASTFRGYFLNKKNISLCPLLFTHEEDAKPYLKKTKVGKNIFNELVYERDIIRSTYKRKFTRGSFIKHATPFLDQLDKLVTDEKPDVVFLNGFGYTNWMLLYTAHKHAIPTIIQHAGIWKKEIWRARNAFSPSIRKIFYDFERDTARWCRHHIFLNNFSRKVFIDLYKCSQISKKSSIIPLPIDLPSKNILSHNKMYKIGDPVLVGAVARWDSIKNHSAILRMASSRFLPESHSIHVVTRIPFMSDFAKKYVKHVKVHPPVQPKELEKFYESMDVVLLPSNFDVSPTVVAESILVGTPVVISDQVGWQDEFKACGLEDHIVPTRASGKELVNVVNNVVLKRLENKKKYALLQKFIRKNHNPSLVMKQYLRVFESAVK